MSISHYGCTNIVQFLETRGYTALYSSLNVNEDHSEVRASWTMSVHTLSGQNKDKIWIEKWSSNALIHGLEPGYTQPAASEADLFTLFADFAWYTLSKNESEAIKMLDDCRSKLYLANLPNAFKASDVFVESNHASADKMPRFGRNVGLVDNHIIHHDVERLSQKQNSRRDQIASIMRALDRSRSPSPLTDVEDLESELIHNATLSSTKTPTRRRRYAYTQRDYQPTAEDSDTTEELPSIFIPHETIKVSGSNLRLLSPQNPIDHLEHYTATATTATHTQTLLDTVVYAQTNHDPPRAVIHDTLIPRRRNLNEQPCKRAKSLKKHKARDSKDKRSARAWYRRIWLLRKKSRKLKGDEDKFIQRYLTTGQRVFPVEKESSKPIQIASVLSLDPSAEGTNTMKRKVISDGVSSENEPPPKKSRGGTSSIAVPSSDQRVTDSQSNNNLTLTAPITKVSFSHADQLPSSTAAQARKTLGPGVKVKSKKARGALLSSEGTIVAENDPVLSGIFTPIARRRSSRQAAQTAQKKTHEQYTNDPLAANVEPEKVRKKPGRPPGKGKGKGKGNAGKDGGTGKREGKEKNVPLTIKIPQRQRHSVLDLKSNLKIKIPPRRSVLDKHNLFTSPAVVASSSTAVPPSSATQESLDQTCPAVQDFVPVVKKRRGRPPKNKDVSQGKLGQKIQTNGSVSSLVAASSLGNIMFQDDSTQPVDKPVIPLVKKRRSKIQDEVQEGDIAIDIGQSTQTTSQVDHTLHNHGHEMIPYYNSDPRIPPIRIPYAPWTHVDNETNYTNGSRPPGMNDTHSWSTACNLQVPKVNFPPLQGESLCPNTRLYKPELPNPPPVWSHSRQELCESLSYFRAYQGGVYTHKQQAVGYLLDGYPARYDIWHSDGRYIISHGGGNSAVDKLTGRASLVEDQAANSGSCAALISSWKAGQPIALVAGSGYRLFPFSLGNMNYVVLGYYHIVHAWEEPEPSTVNPRGYCVRWKFLFRWIEAQGVPWWLNETEKPESETFSLPPEICSSCGESIFQIFGYGWVCTHSNCHAFFQLSDKSNITKEGYNPAFLARREDPLELSEMRLEIRPKPPVQPVVLPDNTQKPLIATSRHFWKGFWCEKCGKLSCREFWVYWKCTNCEHTFIVQAAIQAPPSVNNIKTKITFDPEAGITKEILRLGDMSDPYISHTFILPFNRGKIHFIKASQSQKSLRIANRIFRQYQLDASNDESFFRRYSMKTHKLKGRMLSHYFSQNSGEPYEYVGGTNNTVELDKYQSVREALEYIRSRATLALNFNPEFNEVLSAGYMEEQKMEFHSDGEKDLGPIVASLSLGSPATMKFRPIPSKWMPDDGQVKEGRKTPPVIIELTLRHGDALVMEGAEIQEYYQHAVHPHGFRIAATARRVFTSRDSEV